MPRVEPEPISDPKLKAILERLESGGAITAVEEQIYGKHPAVVAMLNKMAKPRRGEVELPVGMVQPGDGGHKAGLIKEMSEIFDDLGLGDKGRERFVTALEKEDEKEGKKKGN